MNGTEQRLLDALKQTSGTAAELAEILKIHPDTARRRLKALWKRGEIARVHNGRSAVAAVWSLPEGIGVGAKRIVAPAYEADVTPEHEENEPAQGETCEGDPLDPEEGGYQDRAFSKSSRAVPPVGSLAPVVYRHQPTFADGLRATLAFAKATAQRKTPVVRRGLLEAGKALLGGAALLATHAGEVLEAIADFTMWI